MAIKKAEVVKADPREETLRKMVHEIKGELIPLDLAVNGGVFDLDSCTFVVNTQEQADDAGRVRQKIDQAQARWRWEWWGTPTEPRDILQAKSLLARVTARWKPGDTTFERWKVGITAAIGDWRRREQEKRDREVAKVNAREQKKNPGSLLVWQADKVEVEGMATATLKKFDIWFCEEKTCKCKKLGDDQGAIDDHHYRLGIKQLAGAVYAGQAPTDCLDFNAKFLNTEKTRLFGGATKGPGGHKFIYAGVRVWEEESERRAR